jgi:hypothetical protein
MREHKEYRHPEPLIQTGQQHSGAYAQYKKPDIEFRKSKARLEFQCRCHWRNLTNILENKPLP